MRALRHVWIDVYSSSKICMHLRSYAATSASMCMRMHANMNMKNTCVYFYIYI